MPPQRYDALIEVADHLACYLHVSMLKIFFAKSLSERLNYLF